MAEKLKTLTQTQACLELVERADLRPGLVTVKLSATVLEKQLGCESEQINQPELMIKAPFQIRRRGVELKLHLGARHCCITQDLCGFPLSPVCSRDTGYLGLAEG